MTINLVTARTLCGHYLPEEAVGEVGDRVRLADEQVLAEPVVDRPFVATGAAAPLIAAASSAAIGAAGATLLLHRARAHA